jgi:hypothetical protein
MKNSKKIKFPIFLEKEPDFKDLEFYENFTIKEIKKKINPCFIEIKKNKKNKCQSNRLI